MLLIKNARVYAPQDLGLCDLLVAGTQVLAIDKQLTLSGIACEQYDAQGQWLVPGFVDSLAHIAGGGGEGGFATRTPELQPTDAVRAGVTHLVGVLGTDATCRSLADLYGKTQSLNAFGLNCFMHSGSYEIPVKTLTGNLRNDLMLVQPVIGVGEIAIADHRGSQPSWQELARVVSDVRVAAMLAGKGGAVSIHVGEDPSGLTLLNQVADNTALPVNQFLPTHMGRNDRLIDQGVGFAKRGGWVDFTTSTTDAILAMGERPAHDALLYAMAQGAPLSQLCFSSDAQGSLPHFNAAGQLDGLELASIDSLWAETAALIRNKSLGVPDALRVITTNPARALGLAAGKVAVKGGADFNLVDPQALTITGNVCRGRWMMRDGELLAHTPFER
ncbi:beta-aspartyl-peptidase [Simiduia agarivorans]|uniref:Isoaspartyl dipeptidase n=1 Tax=Simiduia agarivorans (strain DSM 21679 / JCM 13881 / BCRC 17597 / SA1) TaxID=1117647 RepID=K4KM59_SIMAS|nr:beta-aspartyl-peptidase [Simiduia agarivorans]AFU99315.1 isoaspartyl dipeptidase [Simiduia agarivorans SA1 = DSM 21679]